MFNQNQEFYMLKSSIHDIFKLSEKNWEILSMCLIVNKMPNWKTKLIQ
jgi:hypothetical protein